MSDYTPTIQEMADCYARHMEQCAKILDHEEANEEAERGIRALTRSELDVVFVARYREMPTVAEAFTTEGEAREWVAGHADPTDWEICWRYIGRLVKCA